MAGLLGLIQELIASLFYKNQPEYEKRKQLKIILKQLKQQNPTYFKPITCQVLPAFADMLLEFVNLLKPVCPIFSKTIQNEDARLAGLYKDYLIKARLPETQQLLFENFSYKAMKEKLLSAAKPADELANIQKDFQEFMANFAGEEFITFDPEYGELDRLVNLCKHNFRNLFNLFDPSFDSTQKGRPPKFTATPGEKIFQELLDLYFIVAGIDISQGVEKNLGCLIERLERDKANRTKQKLKKLLGRIDQLLKQNLNPDFILNLIRVIKQEPNLKPQIMLDNTKYLESFTNRISTQYMRDRERIERERTESAVAQDLSSLFQGASLLKIEGYSESMAGILEAKGFNTFTRIKPLRILKSFILSIFEKELKGQVKKLLVEGYFENRPFQNSLSNIFYSCESILQSIHQFESSLTNSGPVSLATIKKYLKLHEQGKEVNTVLNKLVETIENRAHQLEEEGANLLFDLGSQLIEILNDVKNKMPIQITNIKVIGGKNNREYIAELVNGYNSLSKFIRIIRNFTVIHKIKVPGS